MDKGKTSIVVVFGGKSPEHTVAFKSGLFIMSFLDPERFHVHGVYIKRDGSFATPRETQSAIKSYFANLTIPIYKEGDEVRDDIAEILQSYALYDGNSDPGKSDFISNLANGRYDVGYPVFHGKNGEDGTFQGLFEVFDLPYVGCDVTGSVIGVDKILSKKLCVADGIPVVDFVAFRNRHWRENREDLIRRIEDTLGYPAFIKPPTLGSSIGITRANDRDSLARGIELALRYEPRVLVEKCVFAGEYAVAVIGNDQLEISEPAKFSLDPDFFDYDAKYGAQSLLDLVPAPLTREQRAEILGFARRVYDALELSGTARIDSFLVDGRFCMNEVTPIPGLSSEAAYIMQWEYMGYTKKRLLSRLVGVAFERHREKKGFLLETEAAG